MWFFMSFSQLVVWATEAGEDSATELQPTEVDAGPRWLVCPAGWSTDVRLEFVESHGTLPFFSVSECTTTITCACRSLTFYLSSASFGGLSSDCTDFTQHISRWDVDVCDALRRLPTHVSRRNFRSRVTVITQYVDRRHRFPLARISAANASHRILMKVGRRSSADHRM